MLLELVLVSLFTTGMVDCSDGLHAKEFSLLERTTYVLGDTDNMLWATYYTLKDEYVVEVVTYDKEVSPLVYFSDYCHPQLESLPLITRKIRRDWHEFMAREEENK